MKLFIVYLITYKGNKLPPFYIGSTSLEKFNSGYSGSVSSKEYKHIWKQELKDNFHLFKRRIIASYHSRDEAISAESKFHFILQVHRNSLYVNKCVAGNSPRSMGFIGYGKNNPMYGHVYSDETREKMRNAKLGKKIKESTKEIWRKNRKGHWSGDKNPSKINPPMLGKNHTEEAKKKMSKSVKGKYAGDKNPMYGKSAMKGKTHSPETKAKMAEARKKYWENKSNPCTQEVPLPSLYTESQINQHS
jgi:hypothetical protein